MTHPAIAPGHVALVTGAASGIGRALAQRLAGLGMRTVFADLPGAALEAAAEGHGTAIAADVAVEDGIATLEAAVAERFGRLDLLVNNAVTRRGGGCSAAEADWRAAFAVNFWAALRALQAFRPMMEAQGTPAAIVNVGSKQGITNPPGNAAYNATKAALRFMTEQLAHELRSAGSPVTAHLLIPGWTTTGTREHKPGAWLPEQVVEALLEGLTRGDFYILCPDNEVTPDMDRRRILWGAGDVAENRPPLSRWHADWKARASEACD